ncbi:MAG: hypothetical protein ACYTFF_10965 [Planctomycetota bacterium]|jgi:hypothetical protein
MSKFLTDKYLKYMAAIRGKPIDQDTQCEYCGYNLRGLRYGKVCPECGTPIQYRREPDLAFYEMPLPLIKGFRLSCWMAILAFMGMVVFWVIGGLRGRSAIGPVLILVVVGLWLTAVWRLTRPLNLPQAIAHGFSPRSRLRNAARWLQVGWALAAVSLVANQAQAALVFPTTLFGSLIVVGVLVGIVGIGALALFLARFAHWVRDEFAAKAFITAVWGGVFSAPLVLLLPMIQVTIGPFVIFLVPVILVAIILLLLVTVAAFPVGLYSLSRSVDWSVIHAEDRTDRDRRLHERLAPRPTPRPVSTGPIDLAEPPQDTPGEPPGAGQ